MKKHTDILPDFVYGFMPEETDLHLVIFFEVNNNIPLIKVAKAKMFNAELDTEAMEMLQINNIATDIIENQMRNILPQELFIKSMRIENKMIKISCEI